jgi:D-beta-D-heptose 7-phosphate kinase / D-beta-D-heptose 1-phosphate adenosyltransferase
VATNGCFDLLHAGHVRLLRHARSLGDALLVAVNGDDAVRRLKGPERPRQPLEDRLEVLAALEAVDFVVAFDEDTPQELYEAVRPDVLVKGGDYRPEEVVGREAAGEVVIVPLLEGRSTTSLLGAV